MSPDYEMNNNAVRISSTIWVESFYRGTVNALTMKAESSLNLNLDFCLFVLYTKGGIQVFKKKNT